EQEAGRGARMSVRPVVVAIVLAAGYAAVGFGLRTWRHWRATGSTGWRGLSGAPPSIEWLGGALFAVAVVMGLAAPALELAGVLSPLVAPSMEAGVALGLAGIAG